MAKLVHSVDAQSRLLEAESVVGRGRDCCLKLSDQCVSSRHALLSWGANAWKLKDLNSRNGTWLDGVRLGAGQAVDVPEGAVIIFGHERETWQLTDLGPPKPMVIELQTDAQIVGEDGMLGLPCDDEPVATIYRGSQGRWVLESDDSDAAELAPASVFAVRGALYRFCSPDATDHTQTAVVSSSERNVQLHFRVSRDEEYVELELRTETAQVKLGARAHNHMLLTLARCMLKDREQRLPVSACGWMYKEDLMPASEPTRVDNEIFRLRKHIAQHAPRLAGHVVERRTRTRQLRLGIAQFTIEQI